MENGLPDINLTPEQQHALLDAASKKLGIDRHELERAVSGGKADALRQKAGPELLSSLSDPQALEKLLSTPQARAALKKLMGG